MRAARAMLSSGLNVISGARRRRSARPTRDRRCVATLASPSNVVRPLGVGAHDADEDLGVAQIARDLDSP